MQTQSPSRVRSPHGEAFAVHELVFIRAWAHARGLSLRILLDEVLDGEEFEEMLLLGARKSRRVLRLWRVAGGVVSQAEGGSPHVFGGIHSALSHAGAHFTPQPMRVPAAWWRLLGWRRG